MRSCRQWLMGIAILALCVLAAGTVHGQDAAGLFKTKCAMCHAPDGSGSNPMGKKLGAADFHSPEVQKMTDAELNKVISDGKGKMPAYKVKIDQAGIDALVSFIRTLKK